MKEIEQVEVSTIQEMNKILEQVENAGLCWYPSRLAEAQRDKRFTFSAYACIDANVLELKVTARLARKTKTYVFRLDGAQNMRPVEPAEAYRQMQLAYRVPELENVDWRQDVDLEKDNYGKYEKSAGAFLWTNPVYDGREVRHVWIYDLNSAYGAVIADKIPDLKQSYGSDYVEEGEVGFVDIGDKFALIEAGSSIKAEIKFKLIDSPFKTWAQNCFKLKELYKAKGDKQKANKYKAMLNFAIGYYQRRNPFFRTYVVEKCNKFIKSLVDDDTIFCNTDSIHSARPRFDLDIGMGLGQFKEEAVDVVARYNGANWQVAGQKPKWRGVPEYRLKHEDGTWINLLTDPLPDNTPVYKLVETNNSWRIVDRGI